MAIHCVMIGDIVGSRELEDWPEMFRSLESVLDEANATFQDDLMVRFRPTVGDEFQGGLVTPVNAYRMRVFLKTRLPVDFVLGIGIGEVERPFEDDVGMRGTAFYRARSALEECKERKREMMQISTDESSLFDRTVNTLFQFIESLEKPWTGRQREIICYIRSHPGQTYEQIGAHFGITRQSIQQILKAARWNVISEGESLVNDFLGGSEHMKGDSVKEIRFTNESKANLLYSVGDDE